MKRLKPLLSLIVVTYLQGVAVAAPAISAEKKFVACLEKKQPERLAEVKSGLQTGKYSLVNIKDFSDELPKNDVSFHLIHLLYKFCLADNEATPRLNIDVLRDELLRANAPRTLEVAQ